MPPDLGSDSMRVVERALRRGISMAVSNLPLSVFTPIAVGYTKRERPGFAVYGRLRVLVPHCVGNVPAHARSDDLEFEGLAVGERPLKLLEHAAYLVPSHCGRRRAKHGDRVAS